MSVTVEELMKFLTDNIENNNLSLSSHVCVSVHGDLCELYTDTSLKIDKDGDLIIRP